MNILLTNDDGIYADGLWCLHAALAERHRVDVVAPDRERSAVGHGITLHEPLRAHRVAARNGYRGHAVNGTPADCVKVAVLEILEDRPDLVISGINPGANVGININYSGTVAAAKEAAIYGIRAMAVSVVRGDAARFDDAARFAAGLAERLMDYPMPYGTFLNVNYPDLPREAIAGVRYAPQGVETFSERLEKRVDPRQRTYYWQGCDAQTFSTNPESDGAVLENRWIAITPIKCDMTDYRVLSSLREHPLHD